jgi:hypothetical protein
MDIHKIIQRRIRLREGGVDLSGDLNVVISANVGPRSEPAAEEVSADEPEEKEST